MMKFMIPEHICNVAYSSNFKFWSWNNNDNWNKECYIKSSDAGQRYEDGLVSGERGCLGIDL